jgi:hypothetical protein
MAVFHSFYNGRTIWKTTNVFGADLLVDVVVLGCEPFGVISAMLCGSVVCVQHCSSAKCRLNTCLCT